MRYELAITLRYFFARDRERSLSLITGLAMGGVTLGVAALVVAMSVMNGYQANMVRAMSSALPHVSLLPTERERVPDFDAIERELVETVPVASVSPFLLQEALVSNPEAPGAPMQGVMLRGVDPGAEAKLRDFLAFISDGSPDWERLPASERERRARGVLMNLESTAARGEYPVLLSPALARKLGVGLGDPLVPLVHPRKGEGFSPREAAGRLRVAGHFHTGILAFDELVILIYVQSIARIYPGSERNFSLGVRLTDPLDAGLVAEQLREQPTLGGQHFTIYSWLESNRGIFQVIRVQKVMLFIVLMLIVVIAFFGMVGALVMLVIDKSREIAVLKSLGARDRSVQRIFLVQGLLIGALGTVFGVAAGLGLCWLLDTFPLIDIPPGVYPGSDRIPVRVAWQDLLTVIGGTMAVSLTATLYPSRKAMRMPPVNGLRYG
jgi:lipoprotein-releasing system permease protein